LITYDSSQLVIARKPTITELTEAAGWPHSLTVLAGLRICVRLRRSLLLAFRKLIGGEMRSFSGVFKNQAV